MKNFSQGTDSNKTPDSLDDHPLEPSGSDVTHGADDSIPAFLFLSESNPTKEAWGILSKISNQSISDQTKSLLKAIDGIIGITKETTGGYGRIPPLHAYLDEDGSVLIEWIIGDFRIGFNIEPNIEDSGWHMVSNKEMGENTFSGQLLDKNQIIRLIDTIIKNI